MKRRDGARTALLVVATALLSGCAAVAPPSASGFAVARDRTARAAACVHVGGAALRFARHAPISTARPGSRIAAQMIFSRLFFTQGTLPNA